MATNDAGANPWVLRTDFSKQYDPTWDLLKRLISSPQRDPISGMEFVANVRFVEDPSFAHLSPDSVVRRLPDNYPGLFIFLVDTETLGNREHPVGVIGFSPVGEQPAELSRKPHDTPADEVKFFRALPSTLQSIENNLSIANMDFEDFANAVGADGVFRGF